MSFLSFQKKIFSFNIQGYINFLIQNVSLHVNASAYRGQTPKVLTQKPLKGNLVT